MSQYVASNNYRYSIALTTLVIQNAIFVSKLQGEIERGVSSMQYEVLVTAQFISKRKLINGKNGNFSP